MPGSQAIHRPVRTSMMSLEKMITKGDKASECLKELVGIIEEQEGELNSGNPSRNRSLS